MDSLQTMWNNFMSWHGWSSLNDMLAGSLPLLLFVLIIFVIVKFVIPRLANAAANILWAAIIIIAVFVISSYLGIRIPYLSGFQEVVTQWFDTTFVPAVNSLISGLHGQVGR